MPVKYFSYFDMDEEGELIWKNGQRVLTIYFKHIDSTIKCFYEEKDDKNKLLAWQECEIKTPEDMMTALKWLMEG